MRKEEIESRVTFAPLVVRFDVDDVYP